MSVGAAGPSGGSDRGALELSPGPGWRALRGPIVAVAVLVLANLAVAATWTWPRWSTASASDAAAREEQRAQAILGPALEEARGSHGRVLQAQADLRSLRERVGGRSGSVGDVVSTLRAVVDAAGLQSGRIDYQQEPVQELGLTQLQVSLPVRGDYDSVRGLLERLLEAPVFLVVERIGVATPPGGSGPLQVQLALSAFVEGDVEGDVAGAPSPFASPEEPSADAVAGADPTTLAERLRSRLAALPAIPLAPAELQLQLARLDAGIGDARPSQRNLFDFAPAVLAARQRQERARRAPEAMPEVEEEPSAPFELRGIVRAEELWATLVDADERVHVVTAGSRLPGNYLVVEVGAVYAWLERRGERFRLSLRREGLEEHAWAPPSRIERPERPDRRDQRKKKKGEEP